MTTRLVASAIIFLAASSVLYWEWDASRRAKGHMDEEGIRHKDADSYLHYALMTYVIAAVTDLIWLGLFLINVSTKMLIISTIVVYVIRVCYMPFIQTKFTLLEQGNNQTLLAKI